jgi:hypothetical protein
MCPQQRSRAECPRLVTIFAGLVVLLGPLMCPLAAQQGRMPQVGYDICRSGSFFRAPNVSSGSTAGQNAPGWIQYGRYFFQGP